jgi:iron-sulfur cluster repair protein YtfE (RIC family)
MFTKVNLLEKAMIDLLQKRAAEYMKRTSDLQREFLEAFEHGITLHFAVEEEALFPVLRKTGKDAETLIGELLLQHQSIMKKYGSILHALGSEDEKNETLLKLVQELTSHNQKEEKEVPAIVTRISLEQLRGIDQVAKRLGYRV